MDIKCSSAIDAERRRRIRRQGLSLGGAVLLNLLLAVAPLGAALAQTAPPPASTQVRLSCGPSTEIPDVVLDVPNLSVDEVKITIQKLLVNLNLDARLGGLLDIHAGLTVTADSIDITIKGVKVELHLTVCLDNVRQIITRTLQTIDANPEILQGLLNSVTNLLSTTVNQLGQTVLRTVDSLGNILERTVDTGGTILSQQVVGNASSLPVLSETVNSAGQTVRRVQDTNGGVIELILDSAGNVLSSRVVKGAA